MECQYKCAACGEIAKSFEIYRNHLITFHRDDDFQRTPILCQVLGCPLSFRKYRNFLQHCRRNHDLSGTAQQQALNPDPDSRDEVAGTSDEMPAAKEDISRSEAACFILHMKETHGMTQTGVENMVKGFRHLINKVFKETMTAEESTGGTGSMQSRSIHNAVHMFDGLETAYQQQKYFKEYFSLVLPEPVILGSLLSVQGSPRKRRLVEIPRTIYYVPLEKTIKTLVLQTDFSDHIQQMTQQSNDILKNFCDGEVYKSHPLFQMERHAIQVVLYYDDVEMCNPLGSRIRKHKLGFFYITFANIDPLYRAHLHNTYLLAVANVTDIAKYGLDRVMERFLEEIKRFSTEGFLCSDKQGNIKCVKGTLVTITADTLAAHQMLGFKEGVGFANKKCRNCLTDFSLMQSNFNEENFEMRTMDQHIRTHCKDTPIREADSTAYGVNRLSCFFDIPGFNPLKCSPQDVMHVLLEGCLPYVMKLLLHYYIVINKDFTLAQLNQRILYFNYMHMDARSKPSPVSLCHITSGTLKQSASQMWALGRLLPFFIGDMIDMAEAHWNCFTLMLQILSIVTAPCIGVDEVSYLRQLISFHLAQFKKLFPDKNIIPKQHYLVHVPTNIIDLGPTVHLWCMRFEAKHAYFKNLSSNASFKNICKYLAERHQKELCLAIQNGRQFAQRVRMGKASQLDLDDLPNNLANCMKLRFPGVSAVTFYSWCESDGCLYKANAFVAYGKNDGLPALGRIEKIFVVEKIFLLIECYENLGTCDALHAYAVRNASYFCIVGMGNLTFQVPYPMYLFKGKCHVPIRYDVSALF